MISGTGHHQTNFVALNAASAGHMVTPFHVGCLLTVWALAISPAAHAGSKADQKSNEALLERLKKAYSAFEDTRKDADVTLVNGLSKAATAVKKNRNLVIGEEVKLLYEGNRVLSTTT
ncbi:MAG TPA: hypothetical protein PK992_00585 [Planctomycetaceae bacterium]|nr:hypothetical protein [Planctomycetaceae bacterium]